MVEKQGDENQTENLDADAKEDDFEMILPEFGVCGAGADDQEEEEEKKGSGQANRLKGRAAAEKAKKSHDGQIPSQEEESKTSLKNACYKCKEKPAKF